MSLRAYLVINVTNPRRIHRQRSRSFVRRFLELLSGLGAYPGGSGIILWAAAPESVTDALNILKPIAVSFGALAPAGSLDGIQIGSGTTPVSWNDYRLASPIPHSPSGVVYGAMSYSNIVDEPAGGSFRLIRSFTNNSSTNITIREVGLTARLVTTSNQPAQVLLARDVLTTPIVIAPNATATIRYIIRVTM